MRELGPRGRKWAVSLHVFCSALWFGSAAAMVLLMWFGPSAPTSDAELFAWRLAIKLIDDALIIASAGGALLTGLFLSWRTKWGFFIWYWVAFKLVATVSMVVFGAAFLGPWINAAAEAAGRQGLDALQDPGYLAADDRASVFGSLQLILLAFVLFVSIFKPWGRVGKRQ